MSFASSVSSEDKFRSEGRRPPLHFRIGENLGAESTARGAKTKGKEAACLAFLASANENLPNAHTTLSGRSTLAREGEDHLGSCALSLLPLLLVSNVVPCQHLPAFIVPIGAKKGEIELGRNGKYAECAAAICDLLSRRSICARAGSGLGTIHRNCPRLPSPPLPANDFFSGGRTFSAFSMGDESDVNENSRPKFR